jgi:hypothetical protein
MTYLRYLCLFAHNGVQHILCYVFVLLFFALCILCCQFLCAFLRLVYPMLPVSLCFSSPCVSYVASFSGLSSFDCPFGILLRLYKPDTSICYTLSST